MLCVLRTRNTNSVNPHPIRGQYLDGQRGQQGSLPVGTVALVLRLDWDGHSLGAAALSVLAGQRDEGEQTVQAQAGRLQECLLTDPALVLPPAGRAEWSTLIGPDLFRYSALIG